MSESARIAEDCPAVADRLREYSPEFVFWLNGERVALHNPWNYKPPCTKSIPLDLRVTLTPSAPERWREQEQARLLVVYSSKSASEPCLSLGNSAYFAIRHAILAARRDLLGDDRWIPLGVPATCQQIQRACGVSPDWRTPA